MPRLTMLVSLFIAAILCGSLFAANTQPTLQSINRMPLSFTKNTGQWDDRVLFRANAGGATMWFTKDGVTYQFTRRIDTRSGAVSAPGVGQNRFGFDASGPDTGTPQLAVGRDPLDHLNYDRDSIEQLVLTVKFLGANPNPEIITEGQMEYKCNYFLGNDPTKWHTDVPNYQAIMLKDIYPGIDLKYSGDGNGQAGYEFVAAPGADIAQIKVAYEGAEETSLNADGRLILKTKWGDMTAAVGLGVNSGLVSSRLSLNTENTMGLEAAGQNPTQANSGTLTLSYSTYLGGQDGDVGYAIAVDGSGNAYVTGNTWSSDFPTLDPFQETFNGYYGYDAFVTKLSNSGNLIYSTYLGGGSDDDWGNGIAVDGSGNAYVTGNTWSSDFPTQNPYQSTFQGGGGYSGDAFVTKLSSSGNSLMYSTYLGGKYDDEGFAIVVNSSGNAYVVGWTFSSNFPTLDPFQESLRGSYDAFVTKLSNSGNSLIYSTYLGGGGGEYGNGIAVDGSGNAYVTGATGSTDFPTLNPYQTYLNHVDVFVTKFSSSGNNLIYSTCLGGGDFDDGEGIAVDGIGNAYVTGWTDSRDFPTLYPYQGTFQGGWSDAFVTKLNSSGNGLIYSTYLGGVVDDLGFAIAVDGSGNAYVTGETYSYNFPTQNPYQQAGGDHDAFVTKFSSSGRVRTCSTFLGGGGDDGGHGIAVDGSGNVYVTGYTYSSDFPTQNPFQTAQGDGDAFVTKLSAYSYGDTDGNGDVNDGDVVYLIAYIFSGGSAPIPLAAGDADCNGAVNVSDAVYLIEYMFSGGPAPCGA